MTNPQFLEGTVVRFRDWVCHLGVGYYENNRLALRLFDSATTEPVATCTTNVPCIPLEEDEVLVKSYGENEGMLEALITAGVLNLVEPVELHWLTHPCTVHKCRIC